MEEILQSEDTPLSPMGLEKCEKQNGKERKIAIYSKAWSEYTQTL